MVELIKQLIIPNKNVKEQIDQLLKEAYIGIQDLRKMALDKNLSLEYIESIESFFLENTFKPEELALPKYLQKFAECLSSFWESYSYYNHTQRSRGKFNLFISLKENDLKMNIHSSESECAEILRNMEEYWIASNQVYTKYEISLIKRVYLR